jgi:sulfide dehydrogenase cytochrome subunit
MKSRIAAAAWVLASGLAAAEEPPAPAFAIPYLSREAVRALAANCAACHGPDGRPAPGSDLPPLAGKTQGEMLRQVDAFRRGERPSTVMQQLLRGYTQPELQAMAQYFAQLNRTP